MNNPKINSHHLVFLISLCGQSQMWMGSSFIGPTMGAKCSRWIEWESSAFGLSSIGALKRCSTRTNGTLPVDHTLTIKLVRAFKL